MTTASALDHLPYGVFSAGGAAPARRRAVRRRACVDVAHRAARARPARPSTTSWPSARRSGPRPAPRSPSCAAVRGAAERLPLDDGRAAPAVRGRRLRRLLRLARPRLQRRPDLPPRPGAAAAQLAAPAGRLPRPRRHRRGQRYAGRPAVRPAEGADGGRARRTARAGGSTSRPSSASWSAPARELGSRIGVGELRRPRLRRGRPQRLVGPRHPGLGVRAARPVPRQVVRDLGQRLGDAAGGPRRRLVRPAAARTRRRCRYLVSTGSTDGPAAARHRRRGGAQRRGGEPAAVPHDVLVARPDARPPHRQRRLAPAPATCSPPAPSAGPSPTPAARSSSCSWGGKEPFAGGRTFLEDGDEVTLRYSAPGTGGGRITLGEVTGRIEPARP